MSSRERARHLLVKALYQWQLTGYDESELLKQFSELAEFGRIDQAYFEDLLHKVLNDEASLDALVARFATRAPEQFDVVGRAILFLALTELKSRPDVPTKVVINEAVNLAKRYGAAESFRFINAVSDKAAAELRSNIEASGA